MGILRWIIDSAAGALASSGAGADLRRKAKKYYWVSNSHRRKCNKIIQKANRDSSVLILPWDKWNDCMQSHKRPLTTYRVVKQITFVVNFIKELVGIDKGKEEFEKGIEIKDLPPIKRPKPTPKKIPKKKPKKKETQPERKIKKIPAIKIPARKKEKKRVDSASNLDLEMFDISSLSFSIRNFINKNYLDRLRNIDKKMEREIDELKLNLIPSNRKDYSYLYDDVCRFNVGIFNTDVFS